MIDKTFWLVYKLFKLWTSFELAYKFQRYHQLLVHCLVWKCISFVLADVLKKQLKNLKDTLKKCLDKRNELTKSGAAALKLPKCKFFEQMDFSLKKRETSRRSQTLIIISSLQKLAIWDHHLPLVASDMKPRVWKSLAQPLPEKNRR